MSHLCLSHLGDRDTELFALFSIGEDPFQIELCHMNLSSKVKGERRKAEVKKEWG